jgi:hypothetical protein
MHVWKQTTSKNQAKNNKAEAEQSFQKFTYQLLSSNFFALPAIEKIPTIRTPRSKLCSLPERNNINRKAKQ